MTTPTTRATGRALVDPVLFDRLAARIVADDVVPRSDAERIVDQTLAFLGTCAINPGAQMSPSPRVDLGWHAFILHTKAYASFCQRVAGRFLHHEPTVGEDGPAGWMRRTTTAMHTAGYRVDGDLWPNLDGGKNCNQYHQGCHDSP